MSETLNISLSDKAWLQASLPVRWGGIGVRRVVQLVPSAYLASAVCTTDLTRSLLPTYLQSRQKLSLDSALSAWQDLSSTFNDTAPPPISVGKQRNWDDLICKSESESLLSGTTDPVERARLLAALAEGSGDWLEALPISSIGLKLDDSSVRIAVGLRLGTPLVHPHQCCCGTIVTFDGHHGLSCRKSVGRQSLHSQINEIIHQAFIGAGVLATREPVGLCNSAGVTAKRSNGVTTVPWRKGRCLA